MQTCKNTPYWLDGLEEPTATRHSLPAKTDVLVIGSGYTSLHAALQTSREGSDTVVIDTHDPGHGCSTRNGGQISTSVKPSLDKLSRKFGKVRASGIRQEGKTALNWIEEFLRAEKIDADFERCGRFHAAHTPKQYESLAKDAIKLESEGIEAHRVSRHDQRTEIGTDTYHGGVVFPQQASLNPGKYHRGLLQCVTDSGARVCGHTQALSIEKTSTGFTVVTSKGKVHARNVVVATDGYTGNLTPWLQRQASDTQITHGGRLWLYLLATVIMLLLVVPTFIVVPMSFSDSQYLEFPPSNWSLRWYNEYLESSKWMRARVTSLKVGFLTMLVATPIGTMAAYALFVSGHRMAKFVFLLLLTPMIIPVILIAIGTFYVYGRVGLNNTITGLVIAHTALAIPLVMILITAALGSYDLNQEKVARSLGAHPVTAFFGITLPQLKFSVLTAALLSFLTSFDEVIISIFVSGGVNATITKHMFSALRDFIDPTIAAISTILVLVSTILLLATQYISKKQQSDDH